MKNSTLLMVGILGAVAMMSAGLSLAPVQQASANDGRGDGDGEVRPERTLDSDVDHRLTEPCSKPRLRVTRGQGPRR